MSLAPVQRVAPVCLVLVVLVACASFEAHPPVGGESASGEPVVRRGTLQPSWILTGELQAVRSAAILVPRTSVLQVSIRWMEQAGTLVRQGQKVLELDKTQFLENIEEARLDESFERNELELKRARNELERMRYEYDVRRQQNRLQRARLMASVPEDLRSRKEHQDAQLELARAEIDLAKAQEVLRSHEEAAESDIEVQRLKLLEAQQEVTAAREAIEALTLRAPRDGILVVSEHPLEGRRFQVGDNVWVGLELMSIPTLTTMKVLAYLSDVDDGKVAEGAPALCTLDAYPKLKFEGRVAEIAPVATEQRPGQARRAFLVEIALERSDPDRMRPGMSVKAEILQPAVDDALIVPRSTLDLSSDPPRVRLASGSTAEVRLGPCSALECVVEEGLNDGARLRRRG